MIRFKLLLILTVVLLSGFSGYHNKPYLSRWVINKGCSLKVGGSTNVNKFSCVIADYNRPDTLTFYTDKKSGPLKIHGEMKLDVQNFDCHNPVMTSDLRKTLKAKTFPKLTIRFITISRYPGSQEENSVKGVVSIELAGVMKKFDVDYRYIPGHSGTAILIGTQKVNFTDFDLVPPRKIGGMIQTDNELNVEFNIKVRILN